MDEKPDQIIGQIEAQREELGRNLSELENRVRRTTDWRTYYDRNPMMILGAALGGGILLGTMVGGTSKRRKRAYSSSSSSSGSTSGSSMAAGIMGGALAGSSGSSPVRKPAGPATSIQKSRINETMDHMKAALISFGIAKAREFMTQVIPGFDQHLDEAERSKREHHSNLSGSSQGHGGSDFRTHTEANYRSGGSGYTSASDYRAPEAVGSNPSRP